jgi:hypothetical protein
MHLAHFVFFFFRLSLMMTFKNMLHVISDNNIVTNEHTISNVTFEKHFLKIIFACRRYYSLFMMTMNIIAIKSLMT